MVAVSQRQQQPKQDVAAIHSVHSMFDVWARMLVRTAQPPALTLGCITVKSWLFQSFNDANQTLLSLADNPHSGKGFRVCGYSLRNRVHSGIGFRGQEVVGSFAVQVVCMRVFGGPSFTRLANLDPETGAASPDEQRDQQRPQESSVIIDSGAAESAVRSPSHAASDVDDIQVQKEQREQADDDAGHGEPHLRATHERDACTLRSTSSFQSKVESFGRRSLWYEAMQAGPGCRAQRR